MRAAAVALLSVLWLIPGLDAQETQRGRLVDSVVRSYRAKARMPGLAVAVTTATETVLLRGYGLRREGQTAAVDAHTLFSIGSLTKAFTATGVGLYVAEGKARWDDPVRQYLPWFTTDQSYTTEHATLRDLASMRLGWPSDSGIFALRSREALVAHLRSVPVGAFRAIHGQAGNLSYALLGQSLEAIAGRPWTAVLQERLLDPLQMRETRTSYAAAKATGNTAEGHNLRNDGVVEYLPTTEISPLLMPAGGLYSSAWDLVSWLRVQLGRQPGPVDAATMDSAVAAIQRPYVMLGPLYQAVFAAPSPVVAYGHGWVLYSYRGQAVVEHAGAWDGYSAFAVLLPKMGIGFAMLSNLNMGAALEEMRRLRLDIIDALLVP